MPDFFVEMREHFGKHQVDYKKAQRRLLKTFGRSKTLNFAEIVDLRDQIKRMFTPFDAPAAVVPPLVAVCEHVGGEG